MEEEEEEEEEDKEENPPAGGRGLLSTVACIREHGSVQSFTEVSKHDTKVYRHEQTCNTEPPKVLPSTREREEELSTEW